jgi:hypothetical protein
MEDAQGRRTTGWLGPGARITSNRPPGVTPSRKTPRPVNSGSRFMARPSMRRRIPWGSVS